MLTHSTRAAFGLLLLLANSIAFADSAIYICRIDGVAHFQSEPCKIADTGVENEENATNARNTESGENEKVNAAETSEQAKTQLQQHTP